MKLRSLSLIAAFALGACSNADRFGAGGPDDSAFDPAAAGAIAQPDVLTSQPLPDTPQYFSEIVGDRVLFEVDQTALTPAARATLDGQARWLTTNSDYRAVIEGHADERGTREYNISLSASRANAVRDYLIAQGISASRLTFVPYGKERPLEVCSEEACYAKNRRAVTVITIGTGA